jgi:hypothetical protein
MVLFVSCYLNLYEERPVDKRIDVHFANAHKVIDTGIPIVIFISKCYTELFMKHFGGASNVILVGIDFDEIELVKACKDLSLDLPSIRNIHHDTRNFLLLMNAKIEFMARALLSYGSEHTHAAWIDFGIAHVFKNPWETCGFLRSIHDRKLRENILLFPGSWAKGERADQIWTNVNWRFSGGFFLGDKASILNMFEMTRSKFVSSLLEHKTLIWETNFWAYCEQQGWFQPTWFFADHNDSIIRVPEEYFLEKSARLTDTTRYSPEQATIFWDGPYSRCHAKKDIESYIAMSIHKQRLPLTAVFIRSDGILSTKEYNKMRGAEGIRGVNNIGEVEYAENEYLARIGTYPIMSVLCSRGFKRPNMLHIPLDDEIFTKGLVGVLGDTPSWESRKSVAVWRGGTSGYERPSIRTRVVEKLFSVEGADVLLTRGGWPENMRDIQEYYFGNYMSPQDQMNYKYILIIDGNCIASNHMWVFGSGAVPIMVSHSDNDYWFKQFLIPMVNYVPINYDLSDLVEKIEWLRSHDSEAKSIAAAAAILAAEIFSPSFQRNYLDKRIAEIYRAKYNRIGFDTQLWRKMQIRGDIHEHLAVLREYSGRCESVIECGIFNSPSNGALMTGLLGKPNNSYLLIDTKKHVDDTPFLEACEREGIHARIIWQDDLVCPQEEVDLIFIDTWHIYAKLKRELDRWCSYAKKYILMHDTTVDEWDGESIRGRFDIHKQVLETGWPAEEIAKGLWPAIEEFLAAHPEWYLERRLVNNNGLTILRRVAN